jgi:SAM-dependent methyltransferase
MNFYFGEVGFLSLLWEYLGTKFLKTKSYCKRLKLDLKYRSTDLHNFSPPIPKPSINQNQSPTNNIAEYLSQYLSLQTTVYPFISETSHLNENSVTLDFGCGVGTLAAAFNLAGSESGSYYGYDTNPLVVEFCRNAYRNDVRFNFFGPEIDSTTNYLTNKRITTANEAYARRKKAHPSREDLAKLLGQNKFSCQVSLSVFTHMWPEDAVETLKVFQEFSNRETTFINTWLILDDTAIAAVNLGNADRILPIEVGGVYTYSQLNPLVCTAYPIEKLQQVYFDAGHQIIDIKFGTWSGRNNGVTYQDIVVSRQK